MIRSEITKNQILAAADRNDARDFLKKGKVWRMRYHVGLCRRCTVTQ